MEMLEHVLSRENETSLMVKYMAKTATSGNLNVVTPGRILELACQESFWASFFFLGKIGVL